MRATQVQMWKRCLAGQVNKLPRHKRRRIAGEFILLETEGGLSDARIAKALGVSDSTIRSWRKELPDGLISDEIARESIDGRMVYPSRKTGDITILSHEEVDLLKPLEDMLAIYEEPPPALERPEVRMFVDHPEWKPSTVKGKKVPLNKIARLLGFSGYDDPAMPWWKLTTKMDALAVLEHLKRDPNINRAFNIYLNALKDIFRAQWSIGRIDADELKKVELIPTPRQTSPKKQARIPEISEFIKIVDGYDLDIPSHWMNLSQLVLTFPCGMRPVDVCGVLDKSYLHLDDGYIRLWREKTETTGGIVMVDCFMGVRSVLGHWLSMIPEDVNHVWFKQRARGKREILWDEPIMPANSNLISSRIESAAKRAGVLNYSAYCGRRSYRTFATDIVPEWMIKTVGGWDQKGASWDYFDARIEKMKGIFGKVPEFIEFDNALLEIIFPYLQGKQLELADMLTVVKERRKCSECGKLLPEGSRADKVTCGARCRQRRKARIDAHT